MVYVSFLPLEMINLISCLMVSSELRDLRCIAIIFNIIVFVEFMIKKFYWIEIIFVFWPQIFGVIVQLIILVLG